jgi:hypothetical protein
MSEFYSTINTFQKGFQPLNNMLKDEKGSLICLQIPTIFWVGGRISCQLLKVHRVNDVRQTEIHTAEPRECSAFKAENAIKTLKDKILRRLQSGRNYLKG